MNLETHEELLLTTPSATASSSPKEESARNGKVSMGSIGLVCWDPLNDRWKGLLCERHANPESLIQTLTETLDACHGGSRVTVRVLTTPDADILQIMSLKVPWQRSLLTSEAAIPINTGDIGSLIYFGVNLPERISNAETARQEWELLTKVLAPPPTTHTPTDGYTVEVLRHPSPKDLEDIIRIYRASFSRYISEFTEASLRTMFRDNIVTVVREPGGDIVAVSQAEIATLEIPRIVTEVGSGCWRIVEISETACLPAWRGRGLTQICKMRLLQELNRPSTIVYTESRANHAAVLRSNVNLGMRVAGQLERHCAMESPAHEVAQEGHMANLFVFYLPM